jgi:hypothetical protein
MEYVKRTNSRQTAERLTVTIFLVASVGFFTVMNDAKK